jgi:starvation-inducible DNA-binding protein
VHQLLDDHAARARGFADETAERIATLGGEPEGTPGAVVAQRDWDDYRLGRADAREHLAALDRVYQGIIADHRQAVDKLGDLDVVTQDMLLEQTKTLETHQWLLRAHLTGGSEPAAGDRSGS